jgi:heat-inducible transcriptional repressor
MSERAQYLFKCLVERYISDGQPVGSRTLARDARLELSPATIRNVMADLEDLGLLASPHTSAGRVPTAKGYRLFIDSMLTVKAIDPSEAQRMAANIGEEQDVARLLERTSQVLSEVTRLAGIVTLPRNAQQALRHVEFLPLEDNRVLVIMVINNREVQNRIIHTARRYRSDELLEAANYLNHAFAGKDLKAVRDDLLRDMAQARDEMNRMMQLAIEMAEKVLAPEAPHDDFVVAGHTNLMGVDELSNMEKLKLLFEAFNQKRDILHLMEQAFSAQGVQIFIGKESGYDVLEQCSIVTSRYSADGQVLGVLGVIGPTRMEYERVIPIVDLTAKMLGSALKLLH